MLESLPTKKFTLLAVGELVQLVLTSVAISTCKPRFKTSTHYNESFVDSTGLTTYSIMLSIIWAPVVLFNGTIIMTRRATIVMTILKDKNYCSHDETIPMIAVLPMIPILLAGDS